MANDFSRLSIAEIEQVIEDAQAALEKKRKEMKSDVLQQMRKLASSIGVSIEVVGNSNSRSKSKLPPKYRNPTNKAQTWTGRGPKPKWFKDALAKGKKPEDLLV